VSRLTVGALIAFCTLSGCKKDEPTPKKLLDTGWFVDTADLDAENCRHQVITHEPADADVGWYWRDFPRVYVATDKTEAYEAFLVDEDGVRLDTETVWSSAGLDFVLSFDGGLKANHTYELHMRDCREEKIVLFSTSGYGAPLTGGPNGLVGRTFLLDLVNAEWVQPAALGPLLAIYFTTPVLLGVQYADGSIVDFLGAPGFVDPFGNMTQAQEPSWDFPAVPFVDAPFFNANVDFVNLRFQGSDVPVRDFTLTGTFAGDMVSLGGGILTGTADTRNLGDLIGQPGEPGAVCEYAAGLGITCHACVDGLPYCLDLSVRDVTGRVVDDLKLQVR
jgi:hypothetical protein